MVSDANIERVPPAQIAVGDVLHLPDHLDSEWGDVIAVSEQFINTRCDADQNPNPNGIHEFDAFHFTCDVYNQEGKRTCRRVICEPVGASIGGRTYENTKVARSIQL
jgi:hypothetical protein